MVDSAKNSATEEKKTDFEYKHPLDHLFYARNVTIVGASPNPNFGAGFFLSAFRHSSYSNPVYLINPKYVGKLKDIRGYPIFASISDIPGELDYVICGIKAKLVPDLIRDCVAKKVKYVCIFTSGFSELLTAESKAAEQELVNIIKGSQTRLIGPNCLGALCTKSGITYDPVYSRCEGNVAFASQSGGIANNLCEIQQMHSLYYSKGISFGNQIDLNCLDLLEYYAQDPDTKIIGMYLESTGSADGNAFFSLMRKVTRKKPVVIWKGGQTEFGARAAASHTGAIAGSLKIWKNAVIQAGGTFVTKSHEFWDVLHLFSRLIPKERLPKGKNVGFIVAGGGASVELTDTFSTSGFQIPELQPEIQDKLNEIYPSVNTSVKNPVDTGAMGMFIDNIIKSIKWMDTDPNLDIIAFFMPLNWLSQLERHGAVGYTTSVARSLWRMNKKLTKTFFIICPIFQMSEFNAKISLQFKEVLWKKFIPHFENIIGAATALNHAIRYSEYLQTQT
ncbi:MAG: CoA-binding protein [Candidatus Helarchaeota archaeon]|nr:CoA-binding protein [Candidatus Helarchaeota archaeon]